MKFYDFEDFVTDRFDAGSKTNKRSVGRERTVGAENIFLQKYLQISLKSAFPYNLLPETDLKRVNKKVNTAIKNHWNMIYVLKGSPINERVYCRYRTG